MIDRGGDMSDKQLARVQKRSYQVFTIFGLPLPFTVFDVLPMASSPGFKLKLSQIRGTLSATYSNNNVKLLRERS